MIALIPALFAGFALAAPTSAPVSSTTCNGQTYEYLGLAGYGFTPSDARDKFNDTAGGIGSSAAIDPSSWTLQDNGSYTGLLYALPDRGWNTEGTLNYQPRVHKLHIILDVQQTGSQNLQLFYLDSIRFSENGIPFTGLDPKATGPYLTFDGVTLPSATYTGDGFGLPGNDGSRPSLDSEGLVLNTDGSMFVSDEYGDYIYHFTAQGDLIAAYPPPQAFIPIRNGTVSFNADSPPRYDHNLTISPADPTSGRANNQGLEGLTASPDGRYLYALTQSALVQDGGEEGDQYRRWARLLKMAVDDTLKVEAEYVVPLPVYNNTKGHPKTAAQSEIKYISDTQFLVLSRDSGAGHGQDSSMSLYRRADVFDISNATNINGQETIAPDGVLDPNITAATYCSFLNYNDNSQLAKFGLHNGGAQDSGLLNEKWESFALVPVMPSISSSNQSWGAWSSSSDTGAIEEYFLFSLSDNDFITQNGSMDGGKLPYSDESGYNLLNQVLVFKIRLPAGAQPRVG